MFYLFLFRCSVIYFMTASSKTFATKVCYKPFFCVQLNGRGVGKIIALGVVAMDAVCVTGTETGEIVVVCVPGISTCVVVVVSVTGTGACVVVVASVTGTIVCAIVVVSVDGTGVGVMVVIFETGQL